MERRHPVAGFRCECWQASCDERILLSGREWEEVRSQSNRFAVAPGHVAPDIEAVVKERSHFWLVDKYGETGRIAENLR
jgi:hypothetical protein